MMKGYFVLSKVLIGFISFCTLFFVSVILLTIGITFNNNAHFILQNKCVAYSSFFLVIILLLFSIISAFNFIERQQIKHGKLIRITLYLILFLLQIAVLFSFCPLQVTDSYIISDYALALANNLSERASYNTAKYLSMYGNNHFLLMVSVWCYKIINYLGIENHSLFLGTFNIICIDLSIFLTEKTVNVWKGKLIANKVLFFCILNPFNYLLIYWFYTLTYSLPFISALLYIVALLHIKNTSEVKIFIYFWLFLVILVIGYYLRPVVLIPVVASGIYFLINFINNIDSRMSLSRYLVMYIREKNVHFSHFIVLIMTFLLLNIMISSWCKKYVPDQTGNFPATHWIMMGLRGIGNYSAKDEEFTYSFKTKNEKIKANIIYIHKRIENMGIIGFVRHLFFKIPASWAEGTGDFYYRLRWDRNFYPQYQWIAGEKMDLIVLYCQAFRFITFFLLLFSILRIYQSGKIDYSFLLEISLFGAIFFYLVWETKPVYSVPFLNYIFMLCISDNNIVKSYLSKTRIFIRPLFRAIFFCTFVLCVFNYNNLTNKTSLWKDRVIYDLPFLQYVDKLTLNGNSLTEEFYVKKPFNEIDIYCTRLAKTKTFYAIKLFENNTLIKSWLVGYNDVKASYLKLKLSNNIKINKKNKYKLHIAPQTVNQKDSLAWGYVCSQATKRYNGLLKINAVEQKENLLIGVHLNYYAPYICSKRYILFFICLILYEIFLFYYISKNMNSKGRAVPG